MSAIIPSPADEVNKIPEVSLLNEENTDLSMTEEEALVSVANAVKVSRVLNNGFKFVSIVVDGWTLVFDEEDADAGVVSYYWTRFGEPLEQAGE